MKLTYGDYRPIKQGDNGWSLEKQKARWYYSPSSKTSIPLRQFQKQARGNVSYKTYVKEREKQGILKKSYKPRKKPQRPSTAKPKQKKSSIKKSKTPIKKVVTSKPILNRYQERALFLQNKWATRLSKEYGYQLKFDELPDSEKTRFWEDYHSLVDSGPPAEDDADYYEDLFDLEYEEILDLSYGDTP